MKRKDAVALGLKVYAADAPCKRCRGNLRHVATGACVPCRAEYQARYKRDPVKKAHRNTLNAEKTRKSREEKHAALRAENPEGLTRAEAIGLGLSIYTPLSPCKSGHYKRYTNGACVVCCAAYQKRYGRENRGKIQKQQTAWRSAHAAALREKRRTEYQINDAKREESQRRNKTWKKQNRGRATAIENKRRAAKIERTPPWADHEANARVYVNCPPGMTVDHIIPLQGRRGGKRIVSGLHVHTNLQYLTPGRNSSKGNHYTREDAEAAEAWQINWLRERGLA